MNKFTTIIKVGMTKKEDEELNCMRNLLVQIIAIMAVLVVASVSSVCAASGDVVAQVGSISITKYELGRSFQKLLPMSGSYHGGVSEEAVVKVQEQALQECIERAMKAMYALENEIAPDVVAVKQQYDKVRSGFASDKAFAEALGGESPEAFRSSLFRVQLAHAAEKAAVDSKIVISDDDMRKYYERNTEMFIRPKQYRASHILIKVDPAATKEQREERRDFAQQLVKRARSGANFYDLAYYNSDDRSKYVGGDIGFFSLDQTLPELAAAVEKMKVGEVSDVVETLYGYEVVLLADVKPSGRMSYAEVESTLLPQMKNAHRDKLYADWIGELKGKFTVTRFD